MVHRTHPANASGHRWIEIGRGTWGVVAAVAPDHVLSAIDGGRVDSRSRRVARILGARHLAQAALSGYRPSPDVLAMGVWVDGVHALTALGLVVLDRNRARAGLVDAAVAAAWAVAGYRDLTRVTSRDPDHQQVRGRLAVVVLAHVPGGHRLLALASHPLRDNTSVPDRHDETTT